MTSVRTLSLLLALGLCGDPLAARGATFDRVHSPLQIKLGALPSISLDASGSASASLSDAQGGAHDLELEASIWSTSSFTGTSFFIGVPLLTNLSLSAANQSGRLSSEFSTTNPVGPGVLCSGGCLGGPIGINGSLVLSAAGGLITLPIPLSKAGVGGTLMTAVLGYGVTITAGPWVAGTIELTGVTTDVITIPQRGNPPTTIVEGVAFSLDPTSMESVKVRNTTGGFVSTRGGAPLVRNTVTLSGSNDLASASLAGQVTIVSPLRIDLSALDQGVIPGRLKATLTFVPEPAATLLLASVTTSLVIIGRAKQHRRRRS